MNQRKGFFALIFAAVILGTFGVLVRELAGTFGDFAQVFIRSLFATLVIVVIVLYKKISPFKMDKNNLKYILLFSIFFPSSVLFFTISVNLIKATNTLFMLYAGSLIFTAIFGRIFFKEKFTFKHTAALILAFVGLSMFVYPFSFETLSLGIVLGIFAGLCEGVSHTLRRLMKGLKREVIVFYQSFSGALIALGLLLFSHSLFIKEFHISSIFVGLLFGVLLVSMGYLLAYGFGNFDVNAGTIVLSTELFFAMVINAMFLQEYPTSYEFIGGLLIFSATAIISLKN